MEDIKVPLLEIKEAGEVIEVKQGIAKAKGFVSCMYGQLVEFLSGVKGMIVGFNLSETFIIILGDEKKIKVGDIVTTIPKLILVGVGDEFIGRVVDCLGNPLDEGEKINPSTFYPIFREAKGVMDREPIDEELHTGIKVIDLIIPIGKGQRELIIGDRQAGKTSLTLDIIFNQKDKNVICIYCFIGGGFSSFRKIIHKLKEKGALSYTICVCALASTSIGEQFLAPYTAAALGEYFMFKGKDVLVVFDDLTKHAWVWRQISLLLERSPGREAYPGDIFFIHSQLMERAGRLKKELGGGTMTFFPIAETLQGDITGYIQSNLIAMTDGQIYLNTDLFHQGFKPAIDLGLSVSRIGGKVQPGALRELSKGLRLEYLQYREILRLVRLRTRLSFEAQEKIKKGKVLERLFIQENYKPVSLAEEIILFYAFKKKILEILPPFDFERFLEDFFKYLLYKNPSLVKKIEEDKELTEEIKNQLDNEFITYFRKKEF